MQKFPVKIDLSTFFDDERKFVLILVDPQWENVACLQQRVERIFDVEAVRFQTNDNFFIPSQEPIEVVKFVEALKAFIPKKSLEKSRRKSKKFLHDEAATQPEAALGDEELQPVQELVLKKRKYYSLGSGFSSSTPNLPKRSKNVPLAGHITMACGATIASKSQEITSTSEQQSPEAILALLEDEVVAKESVAGKTKRKRAKKAKSKRNQKEYGDGVERAKNESSIKDQSSTMTLLSGLPSSTLVSQSSAAHPCAEKTISTYAAAPQDKSNGRFGESRDVNMVSTISTTAQLDQPADVTQENATPAAINVIFRCSLDDMEAHRPRVFNCKAINANPKKCDIHIQEHIVLPPVADISAIAEKSICQQTGCDNDAKTVPAQSDTSEQVAASDTVAAQVIGAENVSQAEQAAKTAPGGEEVGEMGPPANESVDAELRPHDETAGDASSSQINDVTMDVTDNAETSAMSESALLDESNVIDLDDEENTCCSEPDLTEIIDLSENEEVNRTTSSAMRSRNASASLNKPFDPTKMSTAEMLPYSTALEKRPAPGDVLLFKFVRQQKASKRRISPFIAGRCVYINRRTQQIKIAIFDIDFAKEYIPEQFTYDLDESTEERFINIKQAEMIEPRIIEV